MFKDIPMPKEGPEHIEGDAYSRVGFLRELGVRQPRTKFSLTSQVPRHIAWEWLVDAVDIWLPELNPPKHPDLSLSMTVLYDQRHVSAYDMIVPPHPESQKTKLRRQLRDLISTATGALSATQMVAHIIRSILTVYPPNEAYLWLVAHQLVPATYTNSQKVGTVPYLLMAPNVVARTPSAITKYWQEVNEE